MTIRWIVFQNGYIHCRIMINANIYTCLWKLKYQPRSRPRNQNARMNERATVPDIGYDALTQEWVRCISSFPNFEKMAMSPSLSQKNTRAETALLQVIPKAYIQGVSTRKIRKLANSLGIESTSRGQVSQSFYGRLFSLQNFWCRLYFGMHMILYFKRFQYLSSLKALIHLQGVIATYSIN